MSRQSKNARNRERAAQITLLHKAGSKAAKKTTPLHGKRFTYRNNPEVQRRTAERIRATSSTALDRPKTSGRAILEKAGGASK